MQKKEKQNKTSVFFGGAVVDADNGFFLLWRCRCKRERRTEQWHGKKIYHSNGYNVCSHLIEQSGQPLWVLT